LVPYVAVTAVLSGFTAMGVFSQDMFVKGSAFALISVMAGSLTGAWAYKE
jgi:hypothetical protein